MHKPLIDLNLLSVVLLLLQEYVLDMPKPGSWDYVDTHFGTNGLEGTYVELSFEAESASSVHVQDLALKVCYTPCKSQIFCHFIS